MRCKKETKGANQLTHQNGCSGIHRPISDVARQRLSHLKFKLPENPEGVALWAVENIRFEKLSDSSYNALTITLANDGEKYVWKDILLPGHSGNSEMAAYRINELLHMGIIPTTEYVEIEEDYLGTATPFIENAFSPVALADTWKNNAKKRQQDREKILRMFSKPEIIQQVALMIVFDGIINNRDRDRFNWMIVLDDESLILIDHGTVNWSPSNTPKNGAELTYESFVKALKDDFGLEPPEYEPIVQQLSKYLLHLPDEWLNKWRAIRDEDWSACFDGLMFTEYDMFFRPAKAKNNSWANFQDILRDGGLANQIGALAAACASC